VKNVTNTSNLPFVSGGYYYGVDEETGVNVTGFNYGYGGSEVDLSILYDISYTTHLQGTFYATLSVNATYLYISGKSTTFTVLPPDNGGPPPGPPSSNNPPVAKAGGPYTGQVNTPILFNGSRSTDDVKIVGYRWDWTNDGTYDINWSAAALTVHIYTTPGTYTATLQVKDGEGLTDTNTTTVTILPSETEDRPPVAEADGPYQAFTYQNLSLDGSRSHGVDGVLINYTWDFGDGTEGYDKFPIHAYAIAGIYNITLIVQDTNNLYSSDTSTVTIILDENRNHVADVIEQAVGKTLTPSDVKSIQVNNQNYDLIDITGDGVMNVLYNPLDNTITPLGQENGKQLIDINKDGIWDYVYDPVSGYLTAYKAPPSPPEFPWWLFAITIVILCSIIIAYYLYSQGYF
jgi:PKD repeat protein